MKQRKKITLKQRLFRYIRFLKWSVLLSLLLFALCWWVIPFCFPLQDLAASRPRESTIILDRDGAPLYHATRDDFVRHRSISFAELPEPLIQATLAAEDKRFWDHSGVDILATSRSVRDAITSRRFVSGASTITQQTVKLTSPKAKRTIGTKITEAFRARRLEMATDKQIILEAYFNHIEYGNRTQGPIHAAKHYFNKPLDQLSLAEYALLAGLPQAPTRHNPRSNPDGAIKRRNWVLDRMAIVYAIPQETINRAKQEPLSLAPPNPTYATPEIAELFAGETSGSIQTTLSKNLQTEVKKIAQRELKKIQNHNVNNAAVVVIDNATGEILCLLGSQDFESSFGGQYNAALIPRSPGSALKPFTYLLGFQHRGLTPATIIPDIPTHYAGPRGPEEIVNYDRQHHGPVTISHALGNSLNVPAVRVLNQSGGPQKLLELLQQFGITTLGDDATPYGLSLAIGGGEVTLLEATNAFATLARSGTFIPTRLKKNTLTEKTFSPNTLDGSVGVSPTTSTSESKNPRTPIRLEKNNLTEKTFSPNTLDGSVGVSPATSTSESKNPHTPIRLEKNNLTEKTFSPNTLDGSVGVSPATSTSESKNPHTPIRLEKNNLTEKTFSPNTLDGSVGVSPATSTSESKNPHTPIRFVKHSLTNSKLNKKIASAEQCYLIAQILSNNSARSMTFGTDSQLRLPFRCAVKTGTSTDYKDNFCIGFTKDYTVGVWVGNIDNTSMQGISGVTGAGPIFHQTMLALHKHKRPTWLAKPAEIKSYSIDPHTGKRLIAGHPRFPISEKISLLRQPLTASKQDYNASMHPYLDQRFDRWITAHPQSFAKVSSQEIITHNHAPVEHFRILSPAQDATYLLDPDLPNKGKSLVLKSNQANTIWTSTTLTIKENTATLTPGKHTLTATNPITKQSEEVSITVERL